jgi:hypothetical protein
MTGHLALMFGHSNSSPRPHSDSYYFFVTSFETKCDSTEIAIFNVLGSVRVNVRVKNMTGYLGLGL